MKIIVCCFTTLDDLKGINRTYENIKKVVLRAGRFSCFDVVSKKDADIFTRLCRDPELEIDNVNWSYPYTGVKRKESEG